MSTADSNLIANSDAVPPVMNDVNRQGGRVRTVNDAFELATTDIQTNDIVRLVRLPVNAHILSIQIANDDLDSNGTPTLVADVGLYDPSDDTAVDDDCFATAITQLQSATGWGTELVSEADDIADFGKTLWEVAGQTSDPGGEYDLCLTFDTGAATGAAGTLAFKVEYVVD